MGNYGIKISKAGFSVLTATPDQLIASSKYNMLKVHAAATLTKNITGAPKEETYTIAHNLGYVPIYICRTVIPASLSGYGAAVAYWQPTSSGSPVEVLYWADTTNLYIRARYNNDGTGYKFQYQIFKDKIV